MLKKIATWWSAGAYGRPPGLKRQILLSNQVALFSASVTFLYQVFYTCYDFRSYWPMVAANVVFLVGYLMVPRINKTGNPNVARNLVLGNVMAQLFVATYITSSGAGIHLFYLTIGAVLPLIFNRYRPRVLLGLGCLVAVLFVVCELLFSPQTGISPLPLPILLMRFFYIGSAVGSIGLTGAFTYLFRVEIDRMETDLTESNRTLEKLSTTDQLTHLINRRGMDMFLEQEWARMRREQGTIAVLMCDVDYFKAYNDHFGHQAGDEILQRLAVVLEQAARRPSDLVIRYGGEEFVLILPNTGASDARMMSERILGSVRELGIPHPQSQVSPFLTVSIGSSATQPTSGLSPMHLFRAADRALYVAKRSGRNRQAQEAPSLNEPVPA